MVETPDVLEIKKDLLPYECTILLGGEQYTLAFNYNATADLFTVDLYKDGNLICAGEPIIYGVPLWRDVYKSDDYPAINIIPKDQTGERNAVTLDNLSDTILLVVDNDGNEYEHVGEIIEDESDSVGGGGSSTEETDAKSAVLEISDIIGLQEKLDNIKFEETDPTVPDWAKAKNKPTYTAEEVGAVPTSRTVNGKALSADISLSAGDVGAVPTSRTVNGKALSSNISLAFSNLADEFSGSGTDGTDGYVAFAQLKITAPYTDNPIEFELICRGRPTSCLVSVRFSNADSTDPPLGTIYYRGSSYGVFIQKTATSTWLLYYQKSESWDGLTVKRVSTGSQGITITHPGGFVTSKPTTNVTNATPYELEKTYPVGAIYISTSSTSPASLFGGTWEQIKGRFLLACGDNGDGWNYSPGSTGGEPTHTLTTNEIPSHKHGITAKGVNSGASTSTSMGTYPIDIDQDKASNWNVNTISIGYTGGSASHNNMPPYLAVYMWERVS